MENRYRARESSSYAYIYIYIYSERERGDFLQVKGSTLSWHKNGTQPQQSDAANNRTDWIMDDGIAKTLNRFVSSEQLPTSSDELLPVLPQLNFLSQ